MSQAFVPEVIVLHAWQRPAKHIASSTLLLLSSGVNRSALAHLATDLLHLLLMLMLKLLLLLLPQIRTQSHSMTRQVSSSASACTVLTHNSHSKRRGQVVAISHHPAMSTRSHFTLQPANALFHPLPLLLLPVAVVAPFRRRRQVLLAGKGFGHLRCLLHAFLLTVAAAAAWHHFAESCVVCFIHTCPQLQPQSDTHCVEPCAACSHLEQQPGTHSTETPCCLLHAHLPTVAAAAGTPGVAKRPVL